VGGYSLFANHAHPFGWCTASQRVSRNWEMPVQALVLAGLSTVIASLAALCLAQAGFGQETSLIAGMGVAGVPNIAAHAALNESGVSPISPVSIGDIRP
jgi:hypothetical protein